MAVQGLLIIGQSLLPFVFVHLCFWLIVGWFWYVRVRALSFAETEGWVFFLDCFRCLAYIFTE